MAHLDYQLDWTQNHLGDMPLGSSVKVFLKRTNSGGRPYTLSGQHYKYREGHIEQGPRKEHCCLFALTYCW